MKRRVWLGLALGLILLLSACQQAGGSSTEPPVNSETENETAEVTSMEESLSETETEEETEMESTDPEALAKGEIYYVGSKGYASFTELLLDLAGNENEKTIFIEEGTYDMFAEYMAEVERGTLVIPPDDVQSPDYFGLYNAFVPNHTRIVGLGKVTLTFTPGKNEITYGASRTWSPLNIYGNVEIYNVEVIGQNCRYCLHNDDHNKYPGSEQLYKNCRFEYRMSEKNADGLLLGFNNTIGFGIDNDAAQTFEDCEIFFNGYGDHSAYYGHNPGTPGDGRLILRNCYIHATDDTNVRVIRLQTLSHKNPGHVEALFENCEVNGGLTLNLYYEDSVQSFDVTFVNTRRMPVAKTIKSGGTVVDPYEVRFITTE